MAEPTADHLLQDVVTMEPYWRPDEIQALIDEQIDPVTPNER